MTSKIARQSLLLFSIILLAGCGGSPNVKVRRMDNRTVAYTSKGEGSPVIVLESGYGEAMSTWAPIFEGLSQVTTVYAYDRPGYGSSTQERDPSTARELAEQLHQNLISTGHAPPYVLVGHSVGGLYVNVFARIYPAEVAGVVLLDPSHPMQFEYLRTEEPDQYADFLTRTANGETPYEGLILKSIHTEVASLEPFPDIPLIVLTSEAVETGGPWLEYQEDLANMSTKGTHRVVAGSGHYIHQDKPQIVTEEIKALLNAIQEAQ